MSMHPKALPIVVLLVTLLLGWQGSAQDFIDERDGQRYNTITIGQTTWMTENLRFITPSSYCYKDDTLM